MISKLDELFTRNGVDELMFVNGFTPEERRQLEQAFRDYATLIIDEILSDPFHYITCNLDDNNSAEFDEEAFQQLKKSINK